MTINYEAFANFLLVLKTKLNRSAINLFLSILKAKETLLFLEKLKSANIQLGWDLELSLSGWIFLRKNFDKAVKLVENLYQEDLEEWKKRQEHSVGAEQNAFLEGLLPKDVRLVTFYPEALTINK